MTMFALGEGVADEMADFSAYDAVVDATHRYSEIFYEREQ